MSNALQALSQLCDICDAIDFATYFLPPCPEDKSVWNSVRQVMYREVILGACGEIRHRSASCVFCHLAYLALDTKSNKFPDDAVVTMSSFCYAKSRSGSVTDEGDAYSIRIKSKVGLGSGELGGQIHLLASDAHVLGISTDFLARVPQEAGFDMKLAFKWLDICRTIYTSACNTPAPQPSDLLAIDLDTMSICCMPQGSEYVALSYCWPAEPYLTLNRANRKELSQKDALRGMKDKLPGTIRDALDCATELPFRYLWIDALCIVQDDNIHKEKQLQQMDKVYSCATLTIVCAYPVARDTPDGCDGLPRFRRQSTDSQRHTASVKGLHMMVASPCSWVTLMKTRWSKRCWTFQEQDLSPRLLYFTPTQVYYECSCNSFCEDVVWESVNRSAYIAPGSTLWSTKTRFQNQDWRMNWGQWHLDRTPLSSAPAKWETYKMALSRYTNRDVTYPTDILKAFEGVKAVLSEAMQTDFWQGIPENILPLALCWQLDGRFRRRETELDGRAASSMLFPSWSWAGWNSPVSLSMFMPICGCKNEAEWYIINHSGVATRLRVQPDDVKEGCGADGNDDLGGHQMSTMESVMTSDVLPNVVPRSVVDATSAEWRDARTLGCWTTCASFTLDGTKHVMSADRHQRLWRRSHLYAIKDPQGITAGCILLPKRFFRQHRVRSMVCEFIALSKSLPQRYWEKPREWQYFDNDVYGRSDRDESWVVNVMMISRFG